MKVIVLLCGTRLEKKIVLHRYFVLSIALCHNFKSLNKMIVATTNLFKDKPFHNNFAVIQYCQEMNMLYLHEKTSLIGITGPRLTCHSYIQGEGTIFEKSDCEKLDHGFSE